MPRYAESTSVDSSKSRAEIERILARYGASSFAYGWDQQNAMVGFVAHNRQIRFILPMPSRTDRAFTHTPSRNFPRSDAQAEVAYEQAVKQRWRALALVVKAKLEAVEAGIATFEDEFLAHTVLPGGETVGDWIGPQIDRAYETGVMPPMLPHIEA